MSLSVACAVPEGSASTDAVENIPVPKVENTPTPKDDYVGGLSACRNFQRAGFDAAKGLLTYDELREEFKKVQRRGSTAEPEIRDASTRMLRSTTKGDAPGLTEAMAAMFAACEKAGY